MNRGDPKRVHVLKRAIAPTLVNSVCAAPPSAIGKEYEKGQFARKRPH
jgi:hypothetical protein